MDEHKTIGRWPPRVKAYAEPDTSVSPLAYMMDSRGQLQPVAAKSAFGFGGSGNFDYSITSPYANIPIQANKVGYAYASVVSVWAARCIEIRSQAVTRIKRNVVDKRTKKPVPNHPFQTAVERAYRDGQDIYSLWETCKLTFGEVFLWPIQNQYHYFSDLMLLYNIGADVITASGFVIGYTYAPPQGGKMSNFAKGDIAFYKTYNPFNTLRGLSPLDSILLELGIDKDVSRVTKAWYQNDARPGLLLIPEVDPGEATAKKFLDEWKANFGKPENAGKPAILPANLKDVKELNKPPNIDDVEIRESMRREICARFGVPLSVAGAWDDANYQSAPEQRRSLYEETIIPECEDLDKWMTNKVLPYYDESDTVEIKSDYTDIKALIEDESTKSNVSNQRLLAGGITRNEYRREAGKPALPGEDMLYIPQGVTVTPVSQAGQPPPPAPAQPQQPAPMPAGVEAPKAPIPTPALPSPGKPSSGAPASAPAGKAEFIAILEGKAQPTAEAELKAWAKKAENGGALKAMMFVCYTTPKEVESFVRGHLRPDMDKAALKGVFEQAQGQLHSEVSSKDFLPSSP